MDKVTSIFLSAQFVLVALIIFSVFYYLNRHLGPVLWASGNRRIRSFLKFMEMTKLIYPPLMGFGLGFVPFIPKPAALDGQHPIMAASVFFVAGLFCQWIVKGIKKALEARGIDIELPLNPNEQKKQGMLR